MKAVGSMIVALCLVGCGEDPQQSAQADATKQAERAMDEYHTADRQGELGQKCVKAREAAKAFAQAKDEANRIIWQAIKEADCQSVGLPAD